MFLGVYFRLVVCLRRLKKYFYTSILPKHKEYVYIVLQGQAYRLAVLHFSLSQANYVFTRCMSTKEIVPEECKYPLLGRLTHLHPFTSGSRRKRKSILIKVSGNSAKGKRSFDPTHLSMFVCFVSLDSVEMLAFSHFLVGKFVFIVTLEVDLQGRGDTDDLALLWESPALCFTHKDCSMLFSLAETSIPQGMDGFSNNCLKGLLFYAFSSLS